MFPADYYTITARDTSEGLFVRDVRLNPKAEVYKGHFPGQPVAPGVCNLAMIAGCASDAVGKPLAIARISRVRFRAPITPDKNPNLRVTFSLTGSEENRYAISAKVTDHEGVLCIECKAELTATAQL